MNLTQELTNARTYFQKGIECLNNVESVFGIKTTGGGVITMPPKKGTLTPAGKRKIAAAQKRRWATANPGNGNRIAV